MRQVNGGSVAAMAVFGGLPYRRPSGWPPLIQHQRPLQYARPTTSPASRSCEAQEPGTCLRDRGNDL